MVGRDVKMTVERGQWLTFSLPIEGMEQTEVIATYHPAYILWQEGEVYDRIRAQSVADFTIIASRLASGL